MWEASVLIGGEIWDLSAVYTSGIRASDLQEAAQRRVRHEDQTSQSHVPLGRAEFCQSLGPSHTTSTATKQTYGLQGRMVPTRSGPTAFTRRASVATKSWTRKTRTTLHSYSSSSRCETSHVCHLSYCAPVEAFSSVNVTESVRLFYLSMYNLSRQIHPLAERHRYGLMLV